MKLVKLSIVALSMGLFLASCGGNTEATETPAADTAAVTEAPAVEPAAPAATDSTAAAAPADTTAAAPAPAAH